MLQVALRAFATNGYDGVSLRTLGAELGVSHILLHQQFGSKEGLWRAAAHFGFAPFVERLVQATDAGDNLDDLHAFIVDFATYSAEHPDLQRLVHTEASTPGARLDYLCDNFIVPIRDQMAPRMAPLGISGGPPNIPLALFFLITEGSGAMFGSPALAAKLFGANAIHNITPAEYAGQVAGILINGLAGQQVRLSVPPASQSRSHGRLPLATTSFVGRSAEVARLTEMLSARRLVTLTGIGGVGKTALAAHTVAALHDQFADGVWWVELADLREGTLLVEEVASVFGVRDRIGQALTDVLVDFFGQRQMLVVLDNCEHLIDEVAKFTEVMLRDCPRLQILATSREVIRVDDDEEAVLRLTPLSCPTVGGDPDRRTVAAYEAVQLFVQRARAGLPGFELHDYNAVAIARSCAQLEGLPLAIELAAARMREMSAEQIADELSDRYELLTHGRRDAPSRQQSLSECVRWSYDLCTWSEQQLWCRLSVFAASFNSATAQEICGEEMPSGEFLGLLQALVDKSILIRTENEGVVSFRLLETLRDYGSGRMTDAERTRLAQRHARWYHQLLVDAESQWFGPDQPQWVSGLMREMPDIREALQFNLSDCPAKAVDMVAGLRRLWLFHAMLSEGSQWTSRVLAAIPSDPSVQRLRIVFAAANIHLERGDLVDAMNELAEARGLLDVVDDPLTRARINYVDGYTTLVTGDLDHGRDCLRRALATTDDVEVQATSMSAMGWIELVSGNADAALEWSEKGLALVEPRGDFALRSILMATAGACHWRLGDLEHAEQLLKEGLQLADRVTDVFGLANGPAVWAWVKESLQQPRHAAFLMGVAAEKSRVSGSPLLMSVVGGFHAECERRIRERLSAEEFQAAWDEGARVSLSDVAGLVWKI